MPITVPASDVDVFDNNSGALPVVLTDTSGNLLATPNVQAILTNQTIAANLFSNNFDTSHASELFVMCQVSALTGTSPNLNVYLLISPDGGTTWYTAYQPVNTTATGFFVHGYGLSQGTPFANLVRLQVTLGGTSPSATLSLWACLK